MLKESGSTGCANTMPSLTDNRIRGAIMAKDKYPDSGSIINPACNCCGAHIGRKPDEARWRWLRRHRCGTCQRTGSVAKPVEQRLEALTDRTPGHGPRGDCHLFLGTKTPQGYGKINSDGPGKLAHRVAYEIAFGPAGNLCVCHRCDNPSCVNPAHFFLGTNSDNVADKIAKGRGVVLSGERSPNAKLTEDAVRDIRSSAETIAALSERYGVTTACIYQTRRGKWWKGVL